MLVLDRDAAFRRAVTRLLASAVPVVEAGSCEDAARVVSSGVAVCAHVVEADALGGFGLAWLAALRRSGVRSPALVVSSTCDSEVVNQTFELGAHYACKPLRPQALRAFAVDAAFRAEGNALAATRAQAADPLGAFAARLRSVHGLSRAEAELVEAALRGVVARCDLAAVSGVPVNTLKSRIRTALKKVGARSLGEIRERALLDVAMAGA